MNFVGLSNFHSLTVLPLVGLGELLITGIIVVAPESITYASSGKCSCTVSPVGTSDVSMGSVTILIEFSVGVVLSSQMPMHIDGTHGRAQVAVGVWLEFSNIHVTYESLSFVSSSLGAGGQLRDQHKACYRRIAWYQHRCLHQVSCRRKIPTSWQGT